MGFIENVKMPIPLLFVPMTNKSFESYTNIKNFIKFFVKIPKVEMECGSKDFIQMED